MTALEAVFRAPRAEESAQQPAPCAKYGPLKRGQQRALTTERLEHVIAHLLAMRAHMRARAPRTTSDSASARLAKATGDIEASVQVEAA